MSVTGGLPAGIRVRTATRKASAANLESPIGDRKIPRLKAAETPVFAFWTFPAYQPGEIMKAGQE